MTGWRDHFDDAIAAQRPRRPGARIVPAALDAAALAQAWTAVYLGDLAPAPGPVLPGDSTFWCDTTGGCSAGIDLKRISALQLAGFVSGNISGFVPLALVTAGSSGNLTSASGVSVDPTQIVPDDWGMTVANHGILSAGNDAGIGVADDTNPNEYWIFGSSNGNAYIGHSAGAGQNWPLEITQVQGLFYNGDLVVTDAPADGILYGRLDSGWVPVPGPAGPTSITVTTPGPTTVPDGTDRVFVDVPNAAVALNLPLNDCLVMERSGSPGPISCAPPPGTTINGQASFTLVNPWQPAWFIYDGANFGMV